MLSQEVVDRFHSRTRPSPDGCTLWIAGKSSNGYGTFYANRKFQHVHRLAWQMAKGPIPDGLVVCHRCDVRNCVNVEHLFLGTRADNNWDAVHKGRRTWVSGENHPRAKLSAADVVEIRNSDQTISALARHYKVDRRTIRMARNKMLWKHVE